MAIITATGSKLYIGPAVTNATNTQVEYEALTFVEVGELENLGEFGDEANAVNFTSLNDSRVRKAKGARDAGTIQATAGRDPFDAGQLALKAAERTNNEFAFKVLIPDGPTEDFTDSVVYFRGLVMTARDVVGGADNVVRTQFRIGINSEILEVPSEELP